MNEVQKLRLEINELKDAYNKIKSQITEIHALHKFGIKKLQEIKNLIEEPENNLWENLQLKHRKVQN